MDNGQWPMLTIYSVPALFIVYLTLHSSFRSHGPPNLSSTDYLVLQQTLLAYSLMAATVPCLCGFLGRLRTGDLARLFESSMTESDIIREQASRSRSRPRGSRVNYMLSSMDPATPGKIKRAKKQIKELLEADSISDRNATRAWAERRNIVKNREGSIKSKNNNKIIIYQTIDYKIYNSSFIIIYQSFSSTLRYFIKVSVKVLHTKIITEKYKNII